MTNRFPRLKRFAGLAIIAAIWGGLLGLIGFFGFAYAIYADLKSPDRSHLTTSNYGGFLAVNLYRTLFASMEASSIRSWSTSPSRVSACSVSLTPMF